MVVLMAASSVQEFTDQSFEAEVLESAQPVLVDFTAEWCPPCKLLSPTIEKLAGEYAGKAKVGKVDADTNREVLIRYKVEHLPTVLVFRGGEVVGHFRGLRAEKDYRQALDGSA